jgi:DNA polymerase III alpha subunit
MSNLADIDIDFRTDFNPRSLFPWTKASIVRNEELASHAGNSQGGMYPQRIPVDPVSRLSAIPYEDAEKLGYFKIDFLHLGVYDHFESREEIDALLEVEPDWGLLLVPQEQKKLFQLAKHGEILNEVKPKSIEELADVCALIRPGKKQLVKLYNKQRESTRRILYVKDENGYSFKKSHAVAYAMVIVLQLHLISAGAL